MPSLGTRNAANDAMANVELVLALTFDPDFDNEVTDAAHDKYRSSIDRPLSIVATKAILLRVDTGIVE